MHLRQGIGFPSSCRDLALYARPFAWRDPNGFYRLLGLAPYSSDNEVRRRGRQLMSLYHPDGPTPDEDLFLWVSEAYRVLTECRDTYDSIDVDQVLTTHLNKHFDYLEPVSPPAYQGWSYFSEVPRVSDDHLATLAYRQYLHEALRVPTTMPCIAVVLIQGSEDPWLDDGLIYVPVSSPMAILDPTSESAPGPKDKADKGHVTSE